MTLPSFTAERSLYRSGRQYRSSALASAVGGIRPSANLPPGSYQQSCFNCDYSWRLDFFADVLTCSCYDEYGDAWTNNFIFPYDCVNQGSDIANCNGELTCGSCSPYA